MIKLRIATPTELTDRVLGVFREDPYVSSLTFLPGASLHPPGDVVYADIAREAVNETIDLLREMGLHKVGTIQLEPVRTWISGDAFLAEEQAPGSAADAVVWVDVVMQAYGDSELNWSYVSFMTLATMLAGIAIIIDSPILVIGAMVLGPDFGPIAALGVALVRRRRRLLRRAVQSLAAGFGIAILATAAITAVGRALGWVTVATLTAPRPGTAFIYAPDKWSFIVAMIAAAAGVLSLTSARVGGIAGVFISVVTIPAAANVAMGLTFGVWSEVFGSGAQLLINITGMAFAGWLILLAQQQVWRWIAARRARYREVRATDG